MKIKIIVLILMVIVLVLGVVFNFQKEEIKTSVTDKKTIESTITKENTK